MRSSGHFVFCIYSAGAHLVLREKDQASSCSKLSSICQFISCNCNGNKFLPGCSCCCLCCCCRCCYWRSNCAELAIVNNFNWPSAQIQIYKYICACLWTQQLLRGVLKEFLAARYLNTFIVKMQFCLS